MGLSSALVLALLVLGEPTRLGPLRLEGGAGLGTDLYARGSPNQSQYAPQTRLRFAIGRTKLGMIAHFGVGYPVEPRLSIAERNGGVFVEQAVGIRTIPVQRKWLRFGLWALVGFEWLQRRTELDVEGERWRQRTRIHHLSPELGFEWAIPLPLPKLASRHISVALTITHAVAFPFPLGLERQLIDPEGSASESFHPAAELGVVGPAGGIVADLFLGVVVAWDFTRTSTR